MRLADAAVEHDARRQQHPQRATPPEHERDDQRPDQVELLLDRQRPHVPQGRRL